MKSLTQHSQQRLHWSLGRPLRFMGFTVDEWAVGCGGMFPGFYFLNTKAVTLGLVLFIGGFVLAYSFRRFKKLSEHFLVKSWLLSRGIVPAPSKAYPTLLGCKVGK